MKHATTALGLAIILAQAAHRPEGGGGWMGRVVTEWMPARRLRLTEEFAFVDRRGALWRASAGLVLDRRCLPHHELAAALLAEPWSSTFRAAFVVYEAACQRSHRSRHDALRMLAEAAQALGATDVEIRTLYFLVSRAGRDWERKATPPERDEVAATLARIRADSRLTLDAIDTLVASQRASTRRNPIVRTPTVATHPPIVPLQ